MEALNASLIDDNLTLLEPGPASFMVVDPPVPGVPGQAEPVAGLTGSWVDVRPDPYASLVDLTADPAAWKEGFEPQVLGGWAWAGGEAAKENRPRAVRVEEGGECGPCQSGFASREAQTRHVLAAHPGVRVLACGLCQASLFSSAHLKAHMRMHTHEKPLGQQRPQDGKCEHCAQSGLTTNEKLLAHVEQCHAFQCASCGLHLATAPGLTRHWTKVHGPRPKAVLQDSQGYIPATQVSIQLPGKCIFCLAGEMFTTARAFDRHVLDHHPYKCPLCPKMVKHASSIRKHFKTHHVKHRAVFCRHCVSVFISEKDCEIHNQLCQGLDPKRLTAFKIPSLEELQRIEISTPDPDDFVAEVITEIPAVFEAGPCDGDEGDLEDLEPSESFESPEGAQVNGPPEASGTSESHESQPEDEEDEGVHPCKNCDEEFDSEPELLEHIVDNHPFTCPACHRPYKAYDSLRKHCRVMHENLFIAVCKICVLVFTDPESKQAHQRRVHKQSSATDTPKRPAANGHARAVVPGRSSSTDSSEPCFACPYCDRTYLVADSLRKHCKVVHDKVCVSCGYCYLSFKSIEDRKVHLNSPEHLDAVQSCGAERSAVVKPAPVGLESRRAVVKAPGHHPPTPPTPSPLARSLQRTAPTKPAPTSSQPASPKKISSPAKRPATVGKRSTDKAPKFYECFWCDKTYDVGDSLRRHAKKVHDQFVSVCKICTMTYTAVEARDAHMLEAHDYKVGGFQSSSPGAPGVAKTSLRPHLSTPPSPPVVIAPPKKIKLGPEANQCGNWNCDLTFPSRSDLEAHIKEVHPIPCPLCPDRRYRQRRNLSKHYRDIHKGLQVYFCDDCDETFGTEKESLAHANNCEGSATLPDPIESRSTSPDFHGFDGAPTKKLKSQIHATEAFRTALKLIDNPLNLNWEILERVIEFQD